MAVIRRTEALRRRPSGALALVALGSDAVVGLHWVTWAYVELRASLHVDDGLALATVITPFGAGHVLMYVILVGSGLAFLGRALAASDASSPIIGVAGIVIGFHHCGRGGDPPVPRPRWRQQCARAVRRCNAAHPSVLPVGSNRREPPLSTL